MHAAPRISGDIERQIQQRFLLREEEFAVGNSILRLLLPQSSEDLLDEEAFTHDERMPYWADLWPSARALARWLLRQPRLEGRWIELGCGIGLPSLAVKSRGGDILATDFNDDALLFVRANSIRNEFGEIDTMIMDWRDPPNHLERFDMAIAADVLYEQRNAIALADLLPRILAASGCFILADPGRRWADEFRRHMRASNWIEQELDLVEEPALGAGAPSLVQITLWRTPRRKSADP